MKNKRRSLQISMKKLRLTKPLTVAELENWYLPEPNSGCWLWLGDCGARYGYGRATRNRKRLLAHRVVYELYFGEIPKGMFVCHKCDVTCCVNPGHLFLGTAKDNMRDMAAKKRGRAPTFYGDNNPSSKLTAKQAEEIRALRNDRKLPLKSIANMYGITLANVWYIAKGKTWKPQEEKRNGTHS